MGRWSDRQVGGARALASPFAHAGSPSGPRSCAAPMVAVEKASRKSGRRIPQRDGGPKRPASHSGKRQSVSALQERIKDLSARLLEAQGGLAPQQPLATRRIRIKASPGNGKEHSRVKTELARVKVELACPSQRVAKTECAASFPHFRAEQSVQTESVALDALDIAQRAQRAEAESQSLREELALERALAQEQALRVELLRDQLGQAQARIRGLSEFSQQVQLDLEWAVGLRKTAQVCPTVLRRRCGDKRGGCV